MKKNQPPSLGMYFRPLAGAFCAFGLMLVSVLHSSNQLVVGQLSDVSKNSYEGQAALYLQQRGVISGFPDGSFRGSNPVNRVEAAKMLLLAGDYTMRQIQNTGTYADIEPGAWYEQFALNAVDRGIMAGYPNSTFGPSRAVIRAEFLKMLSNAFEIETHLPFHYTDVPTDAWYSEFAGAAEKYNLFLYDKTEMLPSAPMSREEVVWGIYQMFVHRNYNLVVRTPFDYAFTTEPKVPDTLHAAASSSQSSVPTVSSSVSSVPTTTYCDDSDQTGAFPNGFNLNQKGTATNKLMTSNNTFTDSCRNNSNVLLEFFCNDNGYLAAEQVNCPINCQDGACTTEPRETEEEIDPRRPTGTLSSSSENTTPDKIGCHDTDSTDRHLDGANIYTKGTTNVKQVDNTFISETDTCNGDVLTEYYCGFKTVQTGQAKCALGCLDGACISPGKVGSCNDTDANAEFSDGKNFTERASIYVNHPEEGNISYEDRCLESDILEEYYCATNGRVGIYTERCNCVDGVCVQNE